MHQRPRRPDSQRCWASSVLVSSACLSALLAYSLVASTADLFDSRPAHLTLSNGTHLFQRTVVLVSFDGLRPDYLLRGLTPHLANISGQGIYAEYMKPTFPTLTFPNHWTLLTGLYAESHGIIANVSEGSTSILYPFILHDFHDPQHGFTFVNKQPGTDEARWWLGEPVWETVERAGFYSANIMWPGPLMSVSGVSPRYHVPHTPCYSSKEKITQVLDWIDLPLERRPRLILVYEPMLDQAGHAAGPESGLVNQTLSTVSDFANILVQSLHDERNLSRIVDILFVSDHGMEDTSSWEMVYMDDILCRESDTREKGWPGCAGVQYIDGWPSMGFWFNPGVNITAALSRLVLASESKQFDVYTTETYIHDNPDLANIVATMPERYHYSSSRRLAPVWVIPRMGYALTDCAENGSLMSIGNHGYDNDEHSMRAVFVAKGPFAEGVRKRFPEMTDPGQGYVLPPFQNVEVYNLLTRLLGIDKWASKNNGTKGFWDQWTRPTCS